VDITTLFITALIVGLSGAMMPGPLLTVTIMESAFRGVIAGPLIVLGHALLELILVLALLGGLSVYLKMTLVTIIISVVGGAFLIFIGLNMVNDTIKGRVVLDSDNSEIIKGINKMHPVWAGILVSLSNPFWVVWWATVGLTYLTTALNSGTAGIVSFFTGHIMADLLWYCLVAAAIASGRKLVKQQVYQAIILICGLFLIGLGGYFIWTVI
jgi:threonine/homoserine/homoserine lactone efflux protein